MTRFAFLRLHAALLVTAEFFLLVIIVLQPVLRAAEPPVYSEHQDLLYYIDSAGTRQPVKTVEDWERRKAHILANMQIVMGPLPGAERKVPLDLQTVEETKAGQLTRRKVRYHTDSPGQTVSAWLYLPPHDGKKLPAMLCLHQTTGIGKDEPAGLGGSPNLHYALELAQRGYVTLAPDYPSFGEHEYDFAPEKGYISGTMKAIWDNVRAVDVLQSLDEVDPERIGCIGHSLGGHNSMYTACFEPRIKAVVSSCGFNRFHKYYGGNLKGWTSNRYMPLINTRYNNSPDEVPFDFTEIVGVLAPRGFFASAPVNDGNFEVSGVRDCIAAAQPIYELYGHPDRLRAIYPESGHDFPPAAREEAYRFLDGQLKSHD